MKELNNAELLEVSGGADFSYSYKELAEAMTTGGVGGGLAGSVAGGVGAIPGAIGGAAIGGMGYLAGRFVNGLFK
ncbi:hypothetical protein [Photorhabdus aegyptia]|uniref:Bacteriocin class II with double-glycine leader peptide n=1 Tax=Photorhabdus aegyptia TaxID=2805098 RepID=A0A022PJH0_9GAMM|nr:hypothetical protein [Photorhabdus aegyptia]EYU15083.1 Bacteriocin class II with double-glycine leader peptide [Photorhabdus aegyptia]